MVGTIEDAIVRQKMSFTEATLSPIDRTIIGGLEKHLIIPVVDIYNLRRIAAIGHQLMTELEMLSRRHDLTQRMVILSAQDAVDHANHQIKAICGRTRKRYRPDSLDT